MNEKKTVGSELANEKSGLLCYATICVPYFFFYTHNILFKSLNMWI